MQMTDHPFTEGTKIFNLTSIAMGSSGESPGQVGYAQSSLSGEDLQHAGDAQKPLAQVLGQW